MISKLLKQRSPALYRFGLSRFDQGQFRLAIRVAKILHRANNSGAFELEARSYYMMGSADEAIRILEIGCQEFPHVWILWSYLGEYRSNTRQYPLAIEAFEKSKNGDVEVDSWSDLNVGICFVRIGVFDQAVATFRKTKFEPFSRGWFTLCTNMVGSLSVLEEWSEVDEWFKEFDSRPDRSLELPPKDVIAQLLAMQANHVWSRHQERERAESLLAQSYRIGGLSERYLRAHAQIFGKQLEHGFLFDVLLEGTVTNAPGLSGNFQAFKRMHIYASSEDDILRLANIHAEPWVRWTNPEDYYSKTPAQDILEGAIWVAPENVLYKPRFGFWESVKLRLKAQRSIVFLDEENTDSKPAGADLGDRN